MSDSWEAIDGNSRGSLTAVSNVDGKSIVRLWADPITHRLLVYVVGGGGGLTELDPTGAVNGLNATFVFPSPPTWIVSDHAWYRATNSNGSVNWTGTTTITMMIPPVEDIFGF